MERVGSNEADKLANAESQEANWPVPYWYVDAGAAMMLILLTAIEEGFAACFIGNPDQEAILHEILGIPEHVVPIGIALIGNPADDPRAGAMESLVVRAQSLSAGRRRWDAKRRRGID
jgi:nitroreductase